MSEFWLFGCLLRRPWRRRGAPRSDRTESGPVRNVVGRLVLQPAVIAAARDLRCPACLLHRGSLTARRARSPERVRRYSTPFGWQANANQRFCREQKRFFADAPLLRSSFILPWGRKITMDFSVHMPNLILQSTNKKIRKEKCVIDEKNERRNVLCLLRISVLQSIAQAQFYRRRLAPPNRKGEIQL